MEGLKDIKGLIQIEDYSLYIFIFLILVCLIFFGFLIKKILDYKRVISPLKKAKLQLKNLDLSDSKTTAYKLTKFGKILSDEDFSYLEKYKYKKEVISFLDEDIEKIKGFLNAI